MSGPQWESAGSDRSKWVGWRPLAVGVGLFVVGLVVGASLLGDIGETPCYEVEERARSARELLSASFGGGEAGRQAMRDLLELAEEHPGCFAPSEIELLRNQLRSSPDEPRTDQPSVVPTGSVDP